MRLGGTQRRYGLASGLAALSRRTAVRPARGEVKESRGDPGPARATAITCLRLRDGAVPSAGPDIRRRSPRCERPSRIGAGSVFVTWRHDPHAIIRPHSPSPGQRWPASRRCGSTPTRSGAGICPRTPCSTKAEPRGGRLAIRPYLARKRAAIAAHRSQTTALIDDDPSGFRLAPEMLARFDRHAMSSSSSARHEPADASSLPAAYFAALYQARRRSLAVREQRL